MGSQELRDQLEKMDPPVLMAMWAPLVQTDHQYVQIKELVGSFQLFFSPMCRDFVDLRAHQDPRAQL